MSSDFYNIVAWVMILFGVVGAVAMLIVVFWLIFEEIKK
jgi:hypothetical protein